MACEYYYTEFDAAEYASVLSNRYTIASSLHPDYGEQDVLVIDPRGYAVIPKMILSNEVPGGCSHICMSSRFLNDINFMCTNV